MKMLRLREATIFVCALFAFILAGCAGVGAGKGKGVALKEDLAKERVTDLSIIKKLTGRKEYLFFSLPQFQYFLEGYIRGIVTDYEDNPIEGVVVRAIPGDEAPGGGGGKGKKIQSFESSAFDPGISDANGVYRIRFSLSVIKSRVDVQGKLLYNPGWEQQQTKLGRAYEPQSKESSFRLLYDEKLGWIAFSEGVRKAIVRPTILPQMTAPLSGASPKKSEEASGETKKEKKPKEGEEDFFKGFGIEQ